MRIGILGAGEMGKMHAGVYRGMAEVEIAGIVGRDQSRTETVAEDLGIPGFVDPWRLLDDDSVQAIDVTYPTALHREFVVAALERGKHVLCETPLALTLEDADTMIAAAYRHDRVFMVALVMRFVAEYAHIHDEIVSGVLGRPVAAYASRLSRPYWTPERPRDFSLYGDPIVELMIQDFDYLNWIFGLPDAVSAGGVSGPDSASHHVFATLHYPDACSVAEGSARMSGSFPFPTLIRVVCEEGALEAVTKFTGEIPESTLVRYPASGDPETVDVSGDDPYALECRYFVRRVRGDDDPVFWGTEAGRDALRVSLAARASIEQRRRIVLEHV
jgi:predicted dehydrogenase